MRRRQIFLASFAALALSGMAFAAPQLSTPQLRLEPSGPGAPRVALTFDACDGRVDSRILGLLVSEKIPATIFVSGKWLKGNPAAFRTLLDHPDLFEIEDHGAHHYAAVDSEMRIFGVRAAGSEQGVRDEVLNGAAQIESAGAPRPVWFRGATAEYTATAMQTIKALGYRIAGFSLNGDQGASLGAAATARRYRGARDGDVIISHINQPTRPAGAGVVAGIEALKAAGFRFVRLSDAVASEAN